MWKHKLFDSVKFTLFPEDISQTRTTGYSKLKNNRRVTWKVVPMPKLWKQDTALKNWDLSQKLTLQKRKKKVIIIHYLFEIDSSYNYIP